MTTAYLTVDDIPTKHAPKNIDFLVSLNIKPIMFCWGEKLEECRKEAVYALKKRRYFTKSQLQPSAF